jgi:integrase
MAVAKYRRFIDLDGHACDEFIEYLVDDKVKGDTDDEGLNDQSLAIYLVVWNKLYVQGRIFAEAGLDYLSHVPFEGKKALEVAKELTRKICIRIPPVPDAVFLPVTKSAIEWLDTPSADILALQQRYIDAYAEGLPSLRYGPGDSESSRGIAANLAVRAFQFSPLTGTQQPWHERIQEEGISTARSRRGEAVHLGPIQQVRQLVMELRDACAIALQAFVGMRISEVCGLQAYPLNPDTGLPACVEIQLSRSGLYDVFYIKGLVYKLTPSSKEAKWVAGLRPHGTDYLPPPVRAVVTLERLFKPWRDMAGKSDLIVSMKNNCGLPKCAGSIGQVNAEKLGIGYRDWMRKYVALPKEVKDWHLTSHQWRKSFALYTIRTDSRMLPAVSQHFKHLTLAMTEQAYVGNDAELLGILRDTAMQETARILYEVTTGQVLAGGRLAEMIRERGKEIQQRFIGKTADEKRAEIEGVVQSSDLRVWSCEWGWCFFRAEVARCHTQPLVNIGRAYKPNDAIRNPSTCCSCSNLMTTSEHSPFWEARYAKWVRVLSETHWQEGDPYRMVVNERIRQCESILRMMGVRVSPLEDNHVT